MTDAAEDTGRTPLRLALMDDYEVVAAGLRTMLEPFADRIHVVEVVSQLPVVSDVDVVLYDGFSNERAPGPIAQLLGGMTAPVVLYTWRLDPTLVDEALASGMAGCVSKSVSAEDLVDALERVVAGEKVVKPDGGRQIVPPGGDWPGRDMGLTPRESEVLALVAQGLSNQEIADRAYISPNSLKTHIRSVYRKIGVQRRAQAVLWASQHGFLPTRKRTLYED